MADVAHNVEQEFWRPPVVTAPVTPMAKATSGMVEVCDGCGSEFMMGHAPVRRTILLFTTGLATWNFRASRIESAFPPAR